MSVATRTGGGVRASDQGSLSGKIDRYFLSAAAVAAAGLVVGGASSEADASVVYSGIQNVVVPVNDFFGKYIDLQTNTVTTATTPNADINLWSNTFDYLYDGYTLVYKYLRAFCPNSTAHTPNDGVMVDSTSIDPSVKKLANGNAINSGTGPFSAANSLTLAITYYGQNYGPYGNWAQGGDGYVGLQFHDNANTKSLYGWVHLQVGRDGDGNYTATIVDWAYEDTGAGILAGDKGTVPEPTSLGLLAAGAIGMAGWRRRKAVVAA